MSIDDLISQNISCHTSYVPGIQPIHADRIVKLNTNENPYPPSPKIFDKIQEQINDLKLYPESTSKTLRQTIAKIHKIHFDQVIIGNGSDDILNLCVRCFSDINKSIGFFEPSYSLYQVLGSLNGSPVKKISFTDSSFEIIPSSIYSSDSNLFFLTSPHAPSGRIYENDVFSSILKNYRGILVIDEAYADFASDTAIKLIGQNNRLIITRTLSKSYSLAGVRIGYGIASKEIISVLNKAREVYNVDRLAQHIAQVSLEDREYFDQNLAKVLTVRENLKSKFKEWGWDTYQSGANFLFTKPVDRYGNTGSTVAKDAFKFLEQKQIYVRYFSGHPLTSSYLRISIGKKEDIDMLIYTLSKWQKKDQSS